MYMYIYIYTYIHITIYIYIYIERERDCLHKLIMRGAPTGGPKNPCESRHACMPNYVCVYIYIYIYIVLSHVWLVGKGLDSAVP